MLQELGKPLLSECWLESLNQTVKVWCLSTWLLCHFRNEKEATMEDKRGGRGGVTRFTNITGKVPTLLTSIVEPKCVLQVFLGLLLRTGASNSPRK